MKIIILLNLVLLSGFFVFCNQASDKAIQDNTDWVPATVNGIVLGRSTYDDIIKLWGKPDHEAEFVGDPVEPEEGVPTPEELTELQYRDLKVAGQEVRSGVLVGKKSRLVKVISLFVDKMTKDDAIRKYGSDYYLTATGESTCIEKSQKRTKSVGKLDYPIKLVHPQKGMFIQIRNDDTVMMVNYTDKCE